jgi:hypothetical protein
MEQRSHIFNDKIVKRRFSYALYTCDLYTYSYKCIGASDNIFDHFIFLSSVPTTPMNVLAVSYTYRPCSANSPFNLVPIGSPALLIKTQALSSNFTTLPSGLCSFFAVRTTTACLISPLRTLFAADVETLAPGPDSGPKFRCFCTTTMMRSPRIELSITSKLVYNNCAYQSLRDASSSLHSRTRQSQRRNCRCNSASSASSNQRSRLESKLI